MKNLDSNVEYDDGNIDKLKIEIFEKRFGISLPAMYVNFIVKHDGARLQRSDFDYLDPNMGGRKNSYSIAFVNFEEIENKINRLKKADENFPGYGKAFKDGLVPFGRNGGGDLICFDYREDRTTNDPPIVIWYHEIDFEHRVIFIASNFEEFVNILYFNEELEKYLDELYLPPK
ncbi:MAG: SMI1/KNR4 family protein [Puniceicoccales bacterium]|nr:SMI1/KNR4 family protein [Puniceicoccales bacterium]